MKSDILEVKIKGEDNRSIYKVKAPTNDQKKINNIFNILKHKFSIFFKKETEKEKSWFDE